MARKRNGLKKLRDGVIIVVVRALMGVGRIIPNRVGYLLGGWLGSLAFAVSRRDRRIALENLRQAFGDSMDEKSLRFLARRMFRHFGRLLFELPRSRSLAGRSVNKHFTFEGIDIIRNAMAEGRGIVVATGHMGNWELLGGAAARIGLPINVIARELNDSRLNRLVLDFRARQGVKTILRESLDSAKMILRCLKNCEMLALLIDQDIDAEGTFVEFFGKDAFTPIGAAALAERTKALFVTAAVHRTGPGRHKVRVVEIPIDSSQGRDHAIIKATREATAQFEVWIREYPDQWPWFHRRWRRRPDDPNLNTLRFNETPISED